MLENLFEEEGLAGLSWSGDQNSSRVTESDHDSDIDRIRVRKMLRVYIVFEMSQSYDQRSKYRFEERAN